MGTILVIKYFNNSSVSTFMDVSKSDYLNSVRLIHVVSWVQY